MRPLVLLLAAVAVTVVAWALLVPPFQVPDEPAHFAYAQSIAERQQRPAAGPFHLSREEQVAIRAARGVSILQRPELKPPWTERAQRSWHARAGALGGDRAREVLGLGPQRANPPLYYAYEAVPYELASGGDFFDRLYAMRLFSGALMLVTVAAAWLLIGELTAAPLPRLAGAACVGLQPMATFVSGGVNPDAALFALFALALWLGVRTLVRGVTWRRAAALAAVTLGAVLVKPAGLALVPAVGFALVVPAWRGHGPAWTGSRRLAMVGAACALVALALALGGSSVRAGVDRALPSGLGDVRGFFSYLWQFYLPRLPFQKAFAGLGDMAAYETWVTKAWAAFGWLEVRFPDGVYALFAAASAATFGGAALALRRRAMRVPRAVLAFFLLAVLAVLLGLHWADYRSLARAEGQIAQGRYLLPLLPIVGVAVAAALSAVPAPRRAAAAALTIGAMAALQILSLAIVAGRFYV